jgi:hypothetical protein
MSTSKGEKRKFLFTQTKRDLCTKCCKKFWDNTDRSSKKCGHCYRIFCESCYDAELKLGDPKVFVESYGRHNFKVLKQCSGCITCEGEDSRIQYTHIVNPHWQSLVCIKCCVAETDYVNTTTEIVNKKFNTELLKTKLIESHKRAIEIIDKELQILNNIIVEFPDHITAKKPKYDTNRIHIIYDTYNNKHSLSGI